MGVFCARSADASLDRHWSASAPTRAYFSPVRVAAGLAFVMAVLILLGWAWDVTLFKSLLPGQRATQPLTAVCFALSGVSLALSTEHCILCRAARRLCAGVVLLVVIATVWQNFLDVDWGLDQLLFSDAVVHEQPGQYLRPGRPSAGTLVALALLCFCLLLIETRGAAARALYVWLATAAALLAATVVLAYAYDLKAVYTMGFYAHVGLNSGLELAVLSYGVLLRRPDVGWVRVLVGANAGAVSARRLLLWTGTLLVILAGIVRLGASPAMFGAGFEVTLLTVGGLGMLLAAVLAHARRLNALETIRHNVTNDLRKAETQLVRAAHDKDRQISMLAHELRNPLTPLRNGIEIIRQMSSGNPALARTAEMMSRQIVQLVRLVDDLVGTDVPPLVGDSAAGTPLVEPTEGARLRILVADDNADGADSLAMLLQAEGHVVLTAPDGRRAIEVAEAFIPDVILMDVAMPNLDGLAATREIRSRPWGLRIRIIALTAWGQETERRRTREAGMDAHLVKPVDPNALALVLRASE
jgi:CheY-like chemotaxis protein/signal transduction histidine kinase